jgi:protein SCO1/2
LPYYSEASFSPHWINRHDAVLDSFHTIPDFSFTNQNGEIIDQKTFAGKIYVTDFFFTTCPGICPKMTANLKKVQDAFVDESRVLLLSHSVTPDYDKVDVLKKYASKTGAIDGKWHLVTGERDQIYNLGRQFYFVEEDLGESRSPEEFLHTENFILLDQNRHIRGIYNGLNKASVQQLLADIKTLLLEL